MLRFFEFTISFYHKFYLWIITLNCFVVVSNSSMRFIDSRFHRNEKNIYSCNQCLSVSHLFVPICVNQWFAFLHHFPIQKFAKILFKISSEVTLPMISSRAVLASFRSKAVNSYPMPLFMDFKALLTD